MMKIRNNNKGLILVSSLWIVAILALLAIGLAYRISIELHLVKFSREMLKARLACESGLEFASRVLAEDLNNFDSFNETWSKGMVIGRDESIFKDYKLKQAAFTIFSETNNQDSCANTLYGLSDEGSKLNINKATTAELETFFSQLGIENPKEITNSISDWIDADDITSFDGAEDNYYNSLPAPYRCKNAPLSVIEELLLIRGMDEEKFEKIKPFVTVYGDGKININTVSEVVLKSLLISRGALDTTAAKLAKEIINYRLGPDACLATADDGVFERFEDISLALSSPFSLAAFSKCSDRLQFTSEVYRVNITAYSLKAGVKKRAAAILKKDKLNVSMPEPIYWQEE